MELGFKKRIGVCFVCVCVKIVGITIMKNQGSYDGPLLYYVLLLNLIYEGGLGMKTKCSTCIIMECKWIWVFLWMFIIVID